MNLFIFYAEMQLIFASAAKVIVLLVSANWLLLLFYENQQIECLVSLVCNVEIAFPCNYILKRICNFRILIK